MSLQCDRLRLLQALRTVMATVNPHLKNMNASTTVVLAVRADDARRAMQVLQVFEDIV